MPITQEWDNPEQTIYRIDVGEHWTWVEFDAAIDESNRVMASRAPTKVDLILCIKTALPPGNAMPHLRHAGGNQPPNVNRSVIVNEAGLYMEMIIRTVDRTKRWDGPALVKTIREEALKFLDGLTVSEFSEEDKQGNTAVGTAKHWHVFNMIAQKPRVKIALIVLESSSSAPRDDLGSAGRCSRRLFARAPNPPAY